MFDTNIVSDYLRGASRAAVLFQSYDELVISRISWMEIMVGIDVQNPALVVIASKTMAMFRIYGIDLIADLAVAVRKETHAKLPDAIIHATALRLGLNILTRNHRDFKKVSFMKNTAVIVPYTI